MEELSEEAMVELQEDESWNSESSGSQCRGCLRAGHVLATVTRSEQ